MCWKEIRYMILSVNFLKNTLKCVIASQKFDIVMEIKAQSSFTNGWAPETTAPVDPDNDVSPTDSPPTDLFM